ncbi:MAG TPA: YIP1 family protein [Bryobacteraceae bacterium]|nr:YIP1 family protein [Bryobacteraceae bacterium]
MAPQHQKMEQPGISSGVVGMLSVFIDPGRTARGVAAKLSWLWPVITLAIVYMVFGYLMLPYTMQVVDARLNQALAQQGAPAERVEAARNITLMLTRVAFLFTPVLIIGFLALFAWLVMVMGSMAGLRAKFRDVFALMSACSLIPALQYIAAYIVVRAKGDEITSQEQLTPPFGLDIFFPDIHGPLLALLNFFSIFQIWYLIVFTIGLAALAKTSKGKAFAAITPAWVLPLLLRVIQAALQGTTS